MVEALRTPLFVSPSLLSREKPIPERIPDALTAVEKVTEIRVNNAVMIGSICHRVLEEWDFHGSPQELQRSVESVVKWATTFGKGEVESPAQFQGESISISPPCEGGDVGVVMKSKEIPPHTMQTQDVEFVKKELLKILSDFIDSEAYKEIQSAQILGREIPILSQLKLLKKKKKRKKKEQSPGRGNPPRFRGETGNGKGLHLFFF